MNIQNQHDLISLLGKKYDDASISSYLECFNEEIIINDNINKDEGGYFIEFHNYGISFFFDKEHRLVTIHLFSKGKDNFDQFSGKIPFKIEFDMTEKGVIDILGQPSIHGGGGKSTFWGTVPYWIRYDFNEYSLHFKFKKNKKSIELITFMTPDAVPCR